MSELVQRVGLMLIPAGSAPWGVGEAGIYVCVHICVL